MRVTVLTIGSRGDVQPYVALGVGLKNAGFHVRLATHRTFQSFVEQYGLEFAPLAGDIREIMESEAGLKILASANNPVLFLKRMMDAAAPMMRDLMRDCLNACEGSDFVIGSTLGYLNAQHAAEKLGIPIYATGLQPFSKNDLYPATTFPVLPEGFFLERPYNHLSYAMSEQVMWIIASRMGNRARREVLGLPDITRSKLFDTLHNPNSSDILYAFSECVLPRPANWESRIHITGYWFLDQQSQWTPPPELIHFLENGEKPVYIGFGSMSNRDPEAVTKLVLEALRLSNRRAVLLTGWRGMSSMNLPETVLPLENVPHEWLFPQMAAIVHHGGAGTTAAGLRAGVPNIMIPFTADQPFWGEYIWRRGVSPKAIPRKKLTAENLANAITRAVTDQSMRQRAAALGECIRAEDGVARAVEIIERIVIPVSSSRR